MTDKKIEIDGKVPVDDLLSGSLVDILLRVEDLISIYGKDAVIVQDAGHNNILTEIVYKRTETDTEYLMRLKRIQDAAHRAEQQRRKEIANLRQLAKNHGYTLSPKLGSK